MFEIGDTLREARIRQDLTIKDAEDALKIRGKYLQALEQDDFEVLPGATFVRAFLRTYAEYLGLDADVLVAEYSGAHGTAGDASHAIQQNAVPRPRTRSPRRQPNYAVVAVVTIIVIAVLALVFGNRGEEPAVIDPESVSSTTTTTAGSDVGGTGGVAEVQTQADGVIVTEAAGPGTPTEDPDPDSLDLVVEVLQNRCWIVVREESSSGATLYSGTLTEGQQLSYSSGGRLWLRIGDPSVVRLVVDGEALEVPEPYGDFVVSDSGLQRVE